VSACKKATLLVRGGKGPEQRRRSLKFALDKGGNRETASGGCSMGSTTPTMLGGTRVIILEKSTGENTLLSMPWGISAETGKQHEKKKKKNIWAPFQSPPSGKRVRGCITKKRKIVTTRRLKKRKRKRWKGSRLPMSDKQETGE